MALQTLWFVLWALLWAVYFMLDGFDFGTAMLRMFISKEETDRRIALRSLGPVWDGNEVWLVTAGGATFAAFPAVYASLFSFLYLPMLLILLSLIVRGVAIEFRAKVEEARWHAAWDWALAAGSFTAPLVLGLGFGNIFQGLRFDATGYHGSFWGLFNPYGLLTAVLFVSLFLLHGANWLALRTAAGLAERGKKVAGSLWYFVLVVAAAFLVATGFATRLYANYLAHPGWLVVPISAVLALLGVKLCLVRGRALAAFLCSGATIGLVAATGFIGLYPSLIPSSLDLAASLTIGNSASGPATLRIMTIVALVFLPIVIVYQTLVYRFFRAPVTKEDVAEGAESY